MRDEENALEKVKKSLPKDNKRHGFNTKTIEELGLSSADNARLLANSLQVAMLPNIDLKDPVAVGDRIEEYFRIVAQNGMRPTVAGLANALNGMARQRLWEVATGNYLRGHKPEYLSDETEDLIKKAYRIMEDQWENLMVSGKINPVTGIFLGKNHYGYTDKQDIVVKPGTPESEYSAEEIARRYVLPEAKDDTEVQDEGD